MRVCLYSQAHCHPAGTGRGILLFRSRITDNIGSNSAAQGPLRETLRGRGGENYLNHGLNGFIDFTDSHFSSPVKRYGLAQVRVQAQGYRAAVGGGFQYLLFF